MVTKYFLMDTEFTDFLNTDLISIGLVSVDGEHEFYAEINDYNTSYESQFVKQVVVPLLETNTYGVSKVRAALNLEAFLKQFEGEQITLLVDHEYDWILFHDLMSAADVKIEHIHANWIFSTMIRLTDPQLEYVPFVNEVRALQQEYFSTVDNRQHNSLVDARAYQHAWSKKVLAK